MNNGDKVFIESLKGNFEGVLMPSNQEEIIILKLSSGYNISLLKKEIKKSKVLEKHKSSESKKVSEVKFSKEKKTISILHTGGTIASKVDYETGAVVVKFSSDEMINLFPELQGLVNIKSRFISQMSSDDMRFSHYNLIAKEIEKEIKEGVDGIILTQGTDTLHYTAAALSFILDGLSVPVIIVGSQRSSDRGSSDAAMNLVCAVEFIIQSNFSEVGVCMHKSTNDNICWILPGLKCRKMHSSRRDAFRPVNSLPYAEIDFKTKKINIIDNSFRKKEERDLKLCLFKEVKVGWMRSRPQIYADELKIYSSYDGLLLEGTGLGHMPIGSHKDNQEFFESLKKLARKIPVIMSTQTIYGRVDMNVYSPGRTLMDIGILGNYSDMTPETAYIKLAWLLSNYPKKVKEMFSENLRGELSSRLNPKFEIF